jgi:hypothetical protein
MTTMDWIGIIAFIIILIAVIARGGDWFDVLDGNARYQNFWNVFDFNMMFVILCVLVFGGAALFLLLAVKNTATEQTMSQSVPSTHESRKPPSHVSHKTVVHSRKASSN